MPEFLTPFIPYLLFIGSGMVIGALVTPIVYLFKNRIPANGFFIGVVIGAIGNILLLFPYWLLIKPFAQSKADIFDVAVAYQLGVAAALGERKEEARYYFTQVTQADPANVNAWLYLVNLATTPLEAWSYLQEAQRLDPQNPAVVNAVNVVYPQVKPYLG
jgi:hypothetical protein